MSMTFAGTTIPGKQGAFATSPPMLQATRTKFQGIVGTSEINGERGMRIVECHIWIFNSGALYDDASIKAFLRTLDNLVGTHGDIVDTDSTYKRNFKHCTFEGFSPHPRGPIEDSAGKLGWWCEGTLRWTQLYDGEDTG